LEVVHKRYNEAIANANRYVRDKGFRNFPVLMMNGLVMQGPSVERGLMQSMHAEQRELQQMVPATPTAR